LLSQKGVFSVSPQLHHEYTLPGSTMIPTGSQWAIRGSPSLGIVSSIGFIYQR
jgi:hypothetical protein